MMRKSSLWPDQVAVMNGASSVLCWILLAAVALITTRIEAEVSADLQKKINLAIVKGRETLLPTISRLTKNPTASYGMGHLALPLAAALKSGVQPNHPIIIGAFRKLEKMPFTKTYGVSVYLFALDAMARKERGSPLLTGGSRPAAARGKVNSEIQRAVKWLIAARAEGRGWWNYSPAAPGSNGHDFSNTQFAVLGLQIGLEHGVPIPKAVFEEIARCFIGSQQIAGAPMDVRITLSSNLADTLKGRTQTQGLSGRVPPAGWGYRNSRQTPYASMTAAGASCLLVALNGLGKNSRLRFEIKKALAGSYGWIIKNFDTCIDSGRHGYYTLYSLEKVGDIANIETFGKRDWYREGAEKLLASQRGKGTWGSYIDTSLALMFLTRATRLSTANPIIYTKTEDGEKSEMDGDYVYLSKIDGFVSGRAVLQYIAETRRSDLLGIGREVVQNYSHKYRGDLTPILLALWAQNHNSLVKFAKRSLVIVTGIQSTRREDFESWYSEYRIVRDLENRANLDSKQVAAVLKTIREVTLRARLLDLSHRYRFYDLAGSFIEDMHETKDATYRRKIQGFLVLWTGRDLPTPGLNDESAWARVADDWSIWWTAEREVFIVRVEARRRIGLLETLTAPGVVPLGGSTEKEAQRLVDAIIALGPPALPPLRDAMRQREYCYYLIECYETLTGKSLGLADL